MRPVDWRAVTAGLATLALALPAAAAAQTPGVPPQPIGGNSTSAPAFFGAPAVADPIEQRWRVPRHPFMAPNERSNLHNDAYQTDAYRVSGPLGRDVQVSSTLFARICGSVTFDSAGRIVTICIGLDQPVLAMLDPATLETLAAMPLPPRQEVGGNPFTNVSGGGYFYLDDQDRIVAPTTTRHVVVIAETPEPGFEQVADYDLSDVVPAGDGILSALPDWRGRIWFVSRTGVAGWIDPDSGAVHSRELGEAIENSIAVDDAGGVFVVTNQALYRLRARRGEVHADWRRPVPTNGIVNPGQLGSGSGTTPTLIGPNKVAIADGADQMSVIVYRRGRRSRGREICRVPVFEPGAGATENSLIAANRSLIVENNYGYTITAAQTGGLTEPGLSRIDVSKGRCRLVWTSDERAPSVVAKASLENGLIYTYTRPEDGDGAWYLTALDFDTGETAWKRLAGAGLGYNNHYAPVSIGPDGTAYVGVLGGLVRFADAG